MSATARETPTRYTDPELPLGMRQKAIDQVKAEVVGHREVAQQKEFLDAILLCDVDPQEMFNGIRQQHYTGNPGKKAGDRGNTL